MTDLIYLQDSYQRECDATVLYADGTSVVLDQTVLYAQGGGQPFDTGAIARGGDTFKVVAVKKKDGQVVHELDRPGLAVGDAAHVTVDWERRYRLMRMHTASHVLCAVGHKELGIKITGNQLDLQKSRMDFDLEDCDKAIMQGIVDKANALIVQGASISISFMSREEALKIPSMVKLAGALPPEIPIWRLVGIEGIDLQADGGTHVKDIKEIGKIMLLSVDNKVKDNRRIYFTLEP